jgi:hypothetical protein
MLFDLRSSGRRRTIKVVYITLAFLMGGGLVLFGIGGGGALSGGLVDAITQSEGGGDGEGRFEDQERSATAAARANPENAELWAEVARARFNLASVDVDRATGQFSEAGKAQLEAAGRAWEEHLELTGEKENPDSRVASLMVQAYSVLEQYDKAAVAQEVVALDRESAGAYSQLAILAYQANQLRKGDLARDRAVKLTEPDMRESLKGQLEGVRSQYAPAEVTPTPEPDQN